MISLANQKIQQAQRVLEVLGLPKAQQNERSALTLLALAGLTPKSRWRDAAAPQLRILDMMTWMREKYGKVYAPNSRETIRRQTVHQFEQARLVDLNPDDPERPTNSGKTVYRLTLDALSAVRAFGSPGFERAAKSFVDRHGTLTKKYERERALKRIEVILPNGRTEKLSPGPHNELQRLILKHFVARFVGQPAVLYLGDTEEKGLVLETAELERLRIPVGQKDKLPDILILGREKNWLFLIEAVTSHGPVSPKRYSELEAIFGLCGLPRVYVTAFLNFATYKKYASEIAWESEVWIAEMPNHMIHYNGEKFLGPAKPS